MSSGISSVIEPKGGISFRGVFCPDLWIGFGTFQQLRSYLLLPQPETARKAVDSFAQRDTLVPMKLPVGSVVELNTADTTLLKQVPGIGSGRARMIVAYRRQLGGFVRTEQLNELSHWPDSLNRWFRCDVSFIEQIPVNRAGLDRLRNHPYMDFYKAKAILEYRRKRGKIKGLSQLSLFQEFTEKDLERCLLICRSNSECITDGYIRQLRLS